MLVNKKVFETKATTFAKRFAKAWDYYCIASDAYVTAYKEARKDVEAEIVQWLECTGALTKGTSYYAELLGCVQDAGEEQFEHDISRGEHQLSDTTFHKWKKINETMPLDEAFKTFIKTHEFSDIKFHESEDGTVFFQGSGKRKKV